MYILQAFHAGIWRDAWEGADRAEACRQMALCVQLLGGKYRVVKIESWLQGEM